METNMKHTPHTHIAHVSKRSFSNTVVWAIVLSVIIVGASAALARAAHNFRIALQEKPDIAIYLLLPDEGITKTTVLRQSETERVYLAETKNGPELIKLTRGKDQWYASLVEPMHGEK